MEKLREALILLLVTLTLVGCGSSAEGSEDALTNVKIGVANETNKEVWEDVGKRLVDEGIDLEIIHINDYHQLNTALSAGDIDANAFQYISYLAEYNEASGDTLRPIAYTYIPPYGIWGNKEIESIEDVPEDARVAVTNDPANFGYALKQLEYAGLNEMDDSEGYLVTEENITSNPLNLEFIQLEGAQVPRALINEDVELIITGTVTAKDGGFNPDNALYVEDPETTPNIYKIMLVTNENRINDDVLQKVADAFQSEETLQFAEETFGNTYVPTWEKNETPLQDYADYVSETFGVEINE